MKSLLASTAVIFALAGPALADSHSNMERAFSAQPGDGEYRGTHLIGATLWQTEKNVDATAESVNPDELEWNMVGEINDVVITKDGQVDHLIAAVGGVLGLGQKTISVKMDALTFIKDGEEADEWFVVLNTTPDAIEAAPAYDEDQQTDADAMKAEDGDATETANADMQNADQMEDRALTTEELTGVTVVANNEESVGEVSELILSDDGKTIEMAIIDVGGFLGIGEKPVALPLDKLNIEKDDSGSVVRVMIDMPRSELEGMDAWDKN